jgi:glucokinase
MVKALVDPLEEKAREFKAKVTGVGLGMPGCIDFDQGKVMDSPNLAITNNIKMAEKVGQAIGKQTIMDNDANCFVRAEMLKGAGRGYENGFGITIGTGIGSAWYHNGAIYRGEHGNAGEIDRIVIDFDNGIQLEPAYQKMTQSNQADMADKAYRGDPLAEKTYAEFGRYLGISMANVINLIDPQIIILGGSVSQSSDLFLPEAKKAMREFVVEEVARKIKLVKGKLDGQAGAIGAALLVE